MHTTAASSNADNRSSALAYAEGGPRNLSPLSLQYVRNLALLFVRTDTWLRSLGLFFQFALVFAFGSLTHAQSSFLELLCFVRAHRHWRRRLQSAGHAASRAHIVDEAVTIRIAASS